MPARRRRTRPARVQVGRHRGAGPGAGGKRGQCRQGRGTGSRARGAREPQGVCAFVRGLPTRQQGRHMTLSGRALLVVGGGSGIGLAAARIAAEDGARVTIADIDPSASAHADEIGAAFVQCDATDAASAEAAVRGAAEQNGKLDCLFTTVGGAHLGSIEELDPDAWSREIEFNLGSTYNVCRAALPILREQGSGSVVTTSSGFAAMPGIDRAGYTAAKAGVIAFTRSLAAALAPHRARA